jgi:hypothetical protein
LGECFYGKAILAEIRQKFAENPDLVLSEEHVIKLSLAILGRVKGSRKEFGAQVVKLAKSVLSRPDQRNDFALVVCSTVPYLSFPVLNSIIGDDQTMLELVDHLSGGLLFSLITKNVDKVVAVTIDKAKVEASNAIKNAESEAARMTEREESKAADVIKNAERDASIMINNAESAAKIAEKDAKIAEIEAELFAEKVKTDPSRKSGKAEGADAKEALSGRVEKIKAAASIAAAKADTAKAKAEKFNETVEKVKAEGALKIENAKKEAASIIENAKKEAASIIENAKKEAALIVSRAEAEAKKIRSEPPYEFALNNATA